MAPGDLTGSSTWDLVVVGGGPAGAAAAITGAASGLAVLLLEGSTRARRRPGETLHPGVEVVLRELGAADAVAALPWVRHAGHWVEWGAPRRFDAFGGDASGPWHGYQAPREELDALLLQRAADAGARVLRGCRAVDLTVTRGRVDGVLTDHGHLTAGHVVDAGGRRHWSSRRLAVPVERVSPRLVASWGHLEGRWPAREGAPLLQADAAGWTWTARVGPRTYAWVGLDVSGAGRLRPPPDSPAGLRAARGPSGADVTWRRAAVVAAPGLLLAGDAAWVLDPASGSGVLRALVTGTVAARAVADIRRGRLPEHHVIAAYRRWLSDWFRADASRLDRLYRVFPRWPGTGAAAPPAADHVNRPLPAR